MNSLSTLDLLVLVNQAVYCSSIIPQIIVNYRSKTGKGLSDLLLFTFFSAVTVFAVSFYALKMPIGYRISLAAQIFLVGTLVAQRFYYDVFGHKRLLAALYGFVLLGALITLYCVPMCPKLIGDITGWMGFGLFVVNRIPQVLKVQRERSVAGFSLGFVILLGFSALMEICIILYYHLPVIVLCASSWALLNCLVLTYQFYLFSPRVNKHHA